MQFSYPPEPAVLQGEYIAIEPIDMRHLEGLRDAVADGELWKLWYTFVPAPENMEAWITKAITESKEGISLPFIIRRKLDNKIVGSTRYMNIEKDIRRLEIGTTWYAKSAQRSVVNTECKFLLLKHAFEDLQCVAVEFRTHRLNEQSRRAIERLGAQQDGILRNHRMASNGTLRDTVVYSIVNSEWANVKSHLLFKMNTRY